MGEKKSKEASPPQETIRKADKMSDSVEEFDCGCDRRQSNHQTVIKDGNMSITCYFPPFFPHPG